MTIPERIAMVFALAVALGAPACGEAAKQWRESSDACCVDRADGSRLCWPRDEDPQCARHAPEPFDEEHGI